MLHADRSDERLPDGDRSDKLLEEGGSEKLPEGGDEKLPEDTPTGKLIMPCTDRVLPFSFNFGFVIHVFPPDSKI